MRAVVYCTCTRCLAVPVVRMIGNSAAFFIGMYKKIDMRKFKVLVFFMFFASILTFAQGKKPTLMILPSDNWCVQRYFTIKYEDESGRVIHIPDYQMAFQQDAELSGVISLIGQMLTGRGYDLKDAEQEIKAINNRRIEDDLTMSKMSGASLVESPIDMLKRRAKADILIQIGWQLRKVENGNKMLTFIMEAFDSYTSKRVATATGTGKPSSDNVAVMLQKSVESYMDAFDTQMDNYFNGLQQCGREIVLTVRCWDSWNEDLETEYNGEELTDCIQDWLYEHTINGSYNLTDATENFLQFEQVRIPLTDERGRALDARAFASELRKHLQEPPFEITSKVMMRGLGEAMLILGEK